MEVSDFRNDVILAEACRADVDKYCKDVEPGGGRVHACLRHQTAFLSDACRAEEGKLAAAEHRDIRLKPKLARVGGLILAGAERAGDGFGFGFVSRRLRRGGESFHPKARTHNATQQNKQT